MSADARVSKPFKVERDEVRVMFLRAKADTVPAIQEAWAEFEKAVGLRGRKFFGAFDKRTGEYRVCAQLREGDDPNALGFGVAMLAGGAYLCARLQGEPPALYAPIASTFEELAKLGSVDRARPSIEFYRSRTVVDLLLPIA